jgi:hypothetical protein
MPINQDNINLTKIKTVNTENYHFNYIDIQYDNNIISPIIEIYRWEMFKHLKNHIKSVFIKYKLKPAKKSLDNHMNNILVRLIFEGFANGQIYHLQDGLFNIIKSSNSLKNDIKYCFTYLPNQTNEIKEKIYDDINLDEQVDKIIKKIKQFSTNIKLSYIKKKYQYQLYKQKNGKKITCVILKVNNFPINSYIPIAVYNKLKKRFDEYCKTNTKNTALKQLKCDDLIACIMIRYATIQSMGNQMGIPISAKQQFSKCGVNFEGFSSSLNHYYKYYCSMFYDLEKYFGSLGSFMNITYKRGIYMHNPPYEKKLLYNMVKIISESLESSDEKMAFYFGAPIWEYYPEYTLPDIVHNSKFFKKEIFLADQQFPWYDFIKESYATIPKSVRYIMANYYINIKCLKDSTEYWGQIKHK